MQVLAYLSPIVPAALLHFPLSASYRANFASRKYCYRPAPDVHTAKFMLVTTFARRLPGRGNPAISAQILDYFLRNLPDMLMVSIRSLAVGEHGEHQLLQAIFRIFV